MLFFHRSIYIWHICFSILFLMIICVDAAEDLSVLLSNIINGYDARLRPNFGGDPLYVGIELKIAEINEISEVNMDYTSTIFLNQYWKDDRLSFSTKDEMMTFTGGDFPKKIWVPDIFFPADKDSFLHDVTTSNQVIQLHSDGSIFYGMKFTTRESCQMDFRNFPMDSQNCSIEIESYGYTVNDVVMYWMDQAITGLESINLQQYKIQRYETSDRIEKLATGIYQRLTLSFKFERKFGYFFFQMYLPSILIVMLSWVSFWIANDATAARVTLGITTVLTMTTVSNNLRASLPKISYIKAIDIYLVICFTYVFAALIEYSTVNFVYWELKKIELANHNEKYTRKILKKRLNALFTKWFNCKREKKLDKQKNLCPRENLHISKQLSRIVPENLQSEYSTKTGLRPSDLQRKRRMSLPIMDERTSFLMNAKKGAEDDRDVSNSATRNIIRKRFLKHDATLGFISNPIGNPFQIQDVSSIDNYSRIIFPVTFFLCNIIYWLYYSSKHN